MVKQRLVKVAIGQFEVAQGNTAFNLEKMVQMIDEASEKGADIIVFPELAYTGYFLKSLELQELAESQDGFFVQTMCRKAKKSTFSSTPDMSKPEKFPDGSITPQYSSAMRESSWKICARSICGGRRSSNSVRGIIIPW